jgi:hypothetical protein
MIAKDIWENKLKISQSLRTKVADNVLGMDKEYDIYSKNKKIEFYKSALLDSKSVDHLIPFEHSVK